MEYLDVVDENNNLTGANAERDFIHSNGIWHREVAIWIMNEQDEMLLQKRAPTKRNKPNMWSVCAGHVVSGESTENTAIRELEEELSFKTTVDNLELMWIEKRAEILPKEVNRFFQYIYFVKTNLKIEDYKIQLEELSDLKYVTFENFEKLTEDPEVSFAKQKYFPRLLEELKEKRRC